MLQMQRKTIDVAKCFLLMRSLISTPTIATDLSPYNRNWRYKPYQKDIPRLFMIAFNFPVFSRRDTKMVLHITAEIEYG